MHVDHIGLSVSDLDAQLAWYRAAFGFTSAKPFSIPPVGLRGVFLVGPDDVAIELLEKSGSAPNGPVPTDPPSGLLQQGFRHLCFRVDDVDGLNETITTYGGTVLPQTRTVLGESEDAPKLLYLLDPDGTRIELMENVPDLG